MSNTIFVRNLAYGVSQQELENLFGDIGPVKKVSVIKDKGKRKTDMLTRGFAFVKFAMESDAKAAMEALNNTDYQGRKLCIDIAKDKAGKHPAHKQQSQNQSSAFTTPAPAAQEPVAVEAPVEEAADVPKASTKAKKEKTVQDPVDDEAVVEEKPAKKQKKSKKERAEEEAAVEEDKPSKKPKKAKKERAVAAPEDAEANDEPKEPEPMAAPQSSSKATEEAETQHVQSERNARRREHRELARKALARKEALATSDEKSIVIYGLGSTITEKHLKIKMKKIGETKSIELKQEPNSQGVDEPVAYVEWATTALKAKAIEKLNDHVFKGYTMLVRGMDTTSLTDKTGVRLIVRNLQFDVKDADLDKLFKKFGPLAEARVVRMPLEADAKTPLGRSRGFGFVQFKNQLDAEKAIAELNGLKFKGRDIVVDYAVSKSEYLKAQVAPAEEAEDVDMEANDDDGADENVLVDDDEIVESDIEGDHDAEEAEDAEDDAEDAAEDEQDAEDEEDDEEPAAKRPKGDTEAQMLRTVFIRNLSFQTTEQHLKESMEAEFGPVDYARVVMDHGAGLSKGVAFVRFRSKECADAAIARGSVKDEGKDAKKKAKSSVSGGLFYDNALLDGDGIYVDNRLLSVTRAVNKDDATRLADENSATRKAKDKRNMYLAYEGTINVNKTSDEDLALPKMDIEKRRRAIKEKKEKLKNPLFFISPVRLSVRNLALGVDEKVLKTVFREGAIAGLKANLVDPKEVKPEYVLKSGAPVKIELCKIVRDTENIKPGQEPRSRGYGFVQFSQHVHALAALRQLNNNPAYSEYSGRGVKAGKSTPDAEKTRLIIEFALENHGKLKLREKKMNDAKKRRAEDAMLRKAQGETVEKAERKSRGKRQREAKALKKAEPEEAPAAKKPKTDKPKATKTAPKVEKPAPKRKRETVAAPKGPSRKERKHAKALQADKSFEDMVDSYKAQLFRTVESAESTGRWFDE
ncbi:hypothetical protein ACHHYP_08566 [Achlya hypogyna]|uniref:RRM domain-containing protein n=1 Tax=Achlya hypogyna TaxID=1202772 RepID=A0A1V9ZKF3_ACHHY|nr:hypothetical protein ACHHYP_08566 [Achlya hypogyna]